MTAPVREAPRPRGRRARTIASGIGACLGGIALAITLVAVGFGICAGLPVTTELLSRATSGNPETSFTEDELVRAAVATRDYTVGSNDREALADVIVDINRSAGTPYASLGANRIWEAPDEYTLPPDALEHLDDVHRVVSAATPIVAGIAVIACACIGVAAALRGGKAVGASLLGAGAAVIVAFAALGIWALVDFNGLFAVFHSLFFAAGSWTFPNDSLLITMYPIEFWMGMGAVWLATSALASILCVVIGTVLIRAGRKGHAVFRRP